MELIEYGKIVTTHGVNGELRIFPFSSSFHNFDIIYRLFIENDTGTQPREFAVEKKRIHKRSILIKLRGIDTPEIAGGFVGRSVFLNREDLVQTDEDEYYWFELLGLDVVTSDGRFIGTVEHLMETPASDILIVTSGKDEFLVPVNDKFILNIDIEKSEITINPVDGLTE